MAILDQDGTCLLSDVTTGKYNLYLNIGMSEGGGKHPNINLLK